MTIDEAIIHAREVASEQKRRSGACVQNDSECDKFSTCLKCAEEHDQLAEWLEELKMYKSLAPRELVSEKQKNDRAIEYNKGFDYGFNTGYNKAIDDFAEKMKYEYGSDEIHETIDEIAGQLKAGDVD